MIRFILQRHRKDDPCGHGYTTHETFEADVPELERALTRGGTSQNGYDLTELVGAEILLVTDRRNENGPG